MVLLKSLKGFVDDINNSKNMRVKWIKTKELDKDLNKKEIWEGEIVFKKTWGVFLAFFISFFLVVGFFIFAMLFWSVNLPFLNSLGGAIIGGFLIGILVGCLLTIEHPFDYGTLRKEGNRWYFDEEEYNIIQDPEFLAVLRKWKK